MKKILSLLITLCFINNAFADSPLTSTDFYQAYLDEKIVQEALNSKSKLTENLLHYLVNASNPLDIKLAVINAMGWNHIGTSNSKLYLESVVSTKHYSSEINNNYISFKWNANTDELICYAYLKALDNYLDVVDANEIAATALKNTNSFAINFISRLIKAQGLNALNEYCLACQQFAFLKTNKYLVMDMRNSAKKYIFEYMDDLRKGCK